MATSKRKSQALFEILVNTLALSQALVAVGTQKISKFGTQTLSRLENLMPGKTAARGQEERGEELFRVLFNCMLLSQAAGESSCVLASHTGGSAHVPVHPDFFTVRRSRLARARPSEPFVCYRFSNLPPKGHASVHQA